MKSYVDLSKMIQSGSLIKEGIPSSTGLVIKDVFCFRDRLYNYKVSLDSGLVTRYDSKGEYFTFGIKTESKKANGRMCAEMALDFPEADSVISDQVLYHKGVPVAYQGTIYIYRLVAEIKLFLGLHGPLDSKTCVNHKDGCTLHNWLSNVEFCSSRLNNLHGAVVDSIRNTVSNFNLHVDSNKQYSFKYTSELSAYDLEAVINQLGLIDSIKKYQRSIKEHNKNSKVPIEYLSASELNSIYKILKQSGKI